MRTNYEQRNADKEARTSSLGPSRRRRCHQHGTQGEGKSGRPDAVNRKVFRILGMRAWACKVRPLFIFSLSFLTNRRYHDKGGLPSSLCCIYFDATGGNVPRCVRSIFSLSSSCLWALFETTRWGIFPFNFDVSSVRYFVSFHILNLIHLFYSYMTATRRVLSFSLFHAVSIFLSQHGEVDSRLFAHDPGGGASTRMTGGHSICP